MTNDCLGVVLAGGLSSRMGQDKAKLAYKNSDMLSFSKQLLIDSGLKNIAVSGDSHQVQDLVKNAGPVGGIYSIIQQYRPKAILVLPVDLPLMEAQALTQLRIKGELSNKACFFEDHNIPLYLPNNGYLELFLSQAFKNLMSSTGESHFVHKNKSGPSIRALLSQVPHLSITPEKSSLLFNTNTPEQWQQVKMMSRSDKNTFSQ